MFFKKKGKSKSFNHEAGTSLVKRSKKKDNHNEVLAEMRSEFMGLPPQPAEATNKSKKKYKQPVQRASSNEITEILGMIQSLQKDAEGKDLLERFVELQTDESVEFALDRSAPELGGRRRNR